MAKKIGKPQEGTPENRITEARQQIANLFKGGLGSLLPQVPQDEKLEQVGTVMQKIGGTAMSRRQAIAGLAALGGALGGIAACAREARPPQIEPQPTDRVDHAAYIGPDTTAKRAEDDMERQRPPEWLPEEIERLAEAHSVLSSHYINPAFWWHMHTMGIEKEVFKALDAALANPPLLRYHKNGQITARRPNETVSVPPDLEIKIDGNGKNARISRIRANGKEYDFPEGTYENWDHFFKVMSTMVTEGTANLLMPDEMPAPYETTDYIRRFRAYTRIMPSLVKKLLELRRERRYLDPITDAPATNPDLQTFLNTVSSETNLTERPVVDVVANKDNNPDIVQITTLFNETNPGSG
ncbi:MAG: hypothetical protein V1760_00450, partial [Candidatus Peregrinibacteria bacterium]